MNLESATKFSAIAMIVLGIAAIVLPFWVGTLAVLLLAGLMLASGGLALVYGYAARRAAIPVSVLGPWAQVLAGVVLLIWPGLALWLVALVLGGGLIVSGILELATSPAVRADGSSTLQRIAAWSAIVLGGLLIVMGAAGSALLLGSVLGIALIGSGLQRWRLVSGRM